MTSAVTTEPRRSQAEKFWDRLARTWGRPSPEPDQTDTKPLAKTRPYLKATDTVLDYGCAMGSVDLRLADSVRAIHGIDISSRMIAGAKEATASRGVANVTFAKATIFDATIEGNAANSGGGGVFNLNSQLELVNSLVVANDTPASGAGFYVDEGAGQVTIVNSTLSNNVASGDGGGMFSAGWSALTNVVFEHNQAHSPSSLPSFGGGMNIMFGSPSLVNVLFYNNLADYGGGMANQADYGSGTPPSENISPTLTNVTLAGNVARIAGGGIYNLDSDPALQNSILWANQAVSGTQIYNGETSIPTIAYSDIQGSGGSGVGWDDSLGADLDNNLDADPWFRHPVDPGTVPTSTGDLRLRWGSPAIDAGHNDLLPPGVTTDLDGRPRIVNDIVDMGAYENQSRFVMVLPVVFKNSQP